MRINESMVEGGRKNPFSLLVFLTLLLLFLCLAKGITVTHPLHLLPMTSFAVVIMTNWQAHVFSPLPFS